MEAPAVSVPVTVPCCPDCGGALGEAKPEVVSTSDIPAQPQPEVRRYTVEVRACRQCGRKVRGQHPDIAPGRQGATAHRVGPRVKALAHTLHYLHGVPVRRIAAVLKDLTGLQLTQGAITQDALKQTEGAVGAGYAALRAVVSEQPVIHTDDTGWRVGQTAFLMAFVSPSLSVYQIRPRHRNEEVRELIPTGFEGVLVCDRGKSYDATELDDVAQQKCLSHLIRNAADVAKEKTGAAKHFGLRLKELLRQALSLSAQRSQIRPEQYRAQVEQLDNELSIHLRDRRLRDKDNQRLLNGVGAQHACGRLLLFLRNEDVEPTNNRAERDLRPAVIARKVSHCSKNERGARAFEAFTGVLQTLRKNVPSSILRTLTTLIGRQTKPAPT